jgi:phage virion morphogenesis protein
MFKVEVNDQRLTTMLEQIRAAWGNITPALEEIGNEIVEATKDSFDRQRSPFGGAWDPLKRDRSRNRKARKRGGKGDTKILRDTGALFNSIHATVTGNSVEVGSDRKYAAIHQFGGTIQRQAGSGTVRIKRLKKRGPRSVRFARAGETKGVERKTYQSGPYTIRIPARPFLPIDAGGAMPGTLKAQLMDILRDHIVQVRR